jgi:hypothetical protein
LENFQLSKKQKTRLKNNKNDEPFFDSLWACNVQRYPIYGFFII